MSEIIRLNNTYTGQKGIIVQNQSVREYPIHSHTYYEMSFYPKCDGKLNINSFSVDMSSAKVVLITPADFHGVSYFNDNKKSFKICFDERILIDKSILPKTAFLMECGEKQSFIKSMFEEIYENQDNVKYASFLASSIIMAVTSNGNAVIPTKRDLGFERISFVMKYINENFTHNISLAATAKELNICPQYLSEIFKNAVGTSFSEYTVRLRLSYAAELLKTGEHTVTEVCFLSGYRNFSHFLRSFKNEYGVTPKHYKMSAPT